jgi:two-component system OmpR family sensor kinase
LQQVLFLLTGGTLGALVLAGLVGPFLVSRTLRPIEKINQGTANIVSAQDLKQRLPAPKTNDEIGRLTANINDMLERLDNFFQAQVRLSADVSHELQLPLTVIRGNVAEIRQGAINDSTELSEFLSTIDAELDRMARLVADLHLLAQADSGFSLDTQPIRMDKVILDVYRQAQVMANEVDLQLGHEGWATVEGDTDRLKQLLMNLINNAIKHTPAGGKITLSLY